MTPDERNLLTRFLQDLGQARGGLKDAEAADMIGRSLQSNPDAAYVLVQHAIIADQALHAAQDRITTLEAQAQAQAQVQAQNAQPFQGGGSFFGGGAGAAQPGYGQAPPVQPAYQPQPAHGGILGGLFGGGQPAQPGGFGSFLRTAGTTAAGVAGGEFLFNGLSNLFGGHRGFGGGFGGGYGGPENVVINEYGDGGFQGGDGMDDGGYDDGFN